MQSGQADRRAFLLLAELEEAEQGETPEARGAQAHWLREAATARPEPRWRCGHCGTDHAAWAPVCSACGTVGQIGWTAAPRAAMPAQTAADGGLRRWSRGSRPPSALRRAGRGHYAACQIADVAQRQSN